MAFATVNMIGPRTEQREPKEKKKDAMDYILEGLQIAQGVTGIAVNYQTIQDKMSGREMEGKRFADEQAGVMSQKDKAGHLKDYDVVPAGTERSVLMKYRSGPGAEDIEQVSILPKSPGLKTPGNRLITTPGKDGPEQRIVPDVAGASYPAYVKPDKQGKPDEFSQTDISKMAITEGNVLMRETRAYNSVIKSADEASILIEKAKTNPVATAPALRKLARASGEVGVLTDADVEAFGGSQAIFARLERAAESAANGTLPEADAAFAKEIADLMKQNALSNRDSMVNEAVDRFSINAKIPRADAYQKLTGRKLGDQASTTKTQNKGTGIYRPGSILEINGKRYKVEQDGDTLTEVPAVTGK